MTPHCEVNLNILIRAATDAECMLSACIICSHIHLFNQYLLNTNYTHEVPLPKKRRQVMDKRKKLTSKIMVC